MFQNSLPEGQPAGGQEATGPQWAQDHNHLNSWPQKYTPTHERAPPNSSCGLVLQFLHRVRTGERASLLERDSRRRMEQMLTKPAFRTSCVHQPEEALLPRANTLRQEVHPQAEPSPF